MFAIFMFPLFRAPYFFRRLVKRLSKSDRALCKQLKIVVTVTRFIGTDIDLISVYTS